MKTKLIEHKEEKITIMTSVGDDRFPYNPKMHGYKVYINRTGKEIVIYEPTQDRKILCRIPAYWLNDFIDVLMELKNHTLNEEASVSS